MEQRPLMACGCAATAFDIRTGAPICAVHFDSGGDVIAPVQPKLAGRAARCAYFGKTLNDWRHASGFGCRRGEPCLCEQPSSTDLPFFEYRGPGSREALEGCAVCSILHQNKPCPEWRLKDVGEHDFAPLGPSQYDRFYCGCWGWD